MVRSLLLLFVTIQLCQGRHESILLHHNIYHLVAGVPLDIGDIIGKAEKFLQAASVGTQRAKRETGYAKV